MNSKVELRKEFIKKRHALSSIRREEACQKLTKELLVRLAPYDYVLSFASKSKEINLWPLNNTLAKEERLLLPGFISETVLSPFLVNDPKNELKLHPKWNFFEPDPTLCAPFPIEKIGCALIPGVVFDCNHNRLGYGKGYYDRFLSRLTCPLFGIAFTEQLLLEVPIPSEKHDIPLTDVFFF